MRVMANDRKPEILRTAIEIIADEGYGSLSMRGLARASNMKLGALQYHFRTWEELLRALVDYVAGEIRQPLQLLKLESGSLSLRELALFMLEDHPEGSVLTDKLWPQLWAMQQVEPLVSDLLEDVYAEYLELLEALIAAKGSESPRAEALCLMSMLEGESLFTARGRRWYGEQEAVRCAILNFIDERYGEGA